MSHVPGTHEAEGKDELLTIAEIVERFGISRQALHRLRARGIFPAPESETGSTRLRWKASAVEAHFAAHPKRPGRRTDLDAD